MFQYLLLGHLFIVVVGSTCVSVHCLRCSTTEPTLQDSCPSCGNMSCITDTKYANIPSNCKKAFKISVISTLSDIQEGDDITLTCAHNLHNLTLTFWWTKGIEILENQNTSRLLLRNVLLSATGLYSCYVNSSCGSYKSSPHNVNVDNNSIYILLVCGVSAGILILVMGLAMKFKLKRESAKHRERMEQRAQRSSSSHANGVVNENITFQMN